MIEPYQATNFLIHHLPLHEWRIAEQEDGRQTAELELDIGAGRESQWVRITIEPIPDSALTLPDPAPFQGP